MVKDQSIVLVNLSRTPDLAFSLLHKQHNSFLIFTDDNKHFLAKISKLYWELGYSNRAIFVYTPANFVNHRNKLVSLISKYCYNVYYSGDEPEWIKLIKNCKLSLLSVNTIFNFQVQPSFTPKREKLGILMIQFDAYKLTKDCIESLLKTKYRNKKIYLLDNASEDYSSLELFLNYPEIIIISSISRTSYCQGFNILADFAARDNCKYLFITNNDTKGFSYNIFEELIKNLTARIMIVSPKILDFTQKDIHWRPRTKFGMQFDIATEAYLISTAIWRKVGGFNSNFIMYIEDLDLLQRIWKIGGQSLLVTNVKLNHLGNGATKKLIFIPTYYYLRNLIWVQKNRKDKTFFDLIYYFTSSFYKRFSSARFKHKPLIIFYSLLAFVSGLVLNSTTFPQKSLHTTLLNSKTEFRYKIW